MEALKKSLGELYEEFGHTPVTVRLSQILDRYVAEEQRGRLEDERNKLKTSCAR